MPTDASGFVCTRERVCTFNLGHQPKRLLLRCTWGSACTLACWLGMSLASCAREGM